MTEPARPAASIPDMRAWFGTLLLSSDLSNDNLFEMLTATPTMLAKLVSIQDEPETP